MQQENLAPSSTPRSLSAVSNCWQRSEHGNKETQVQTKTIILNNIASINAGSCWKQAKNN